MTPAFGDALFFNGTQWLPLRGSIRVAAGRLRGTTALGPVIGALRLVSGTSNLLLLTFDNYRPPDTTQGYSVQVSQVVGSATAPLLHVRLIRYDSAGFVVGVYDATGAAVTASTALNTELDLEVTLVR